MCEAKGGSWVVGRGTRYPRDCHLWVTMTCSGTEECGRCQPVAIARFAEVHCMYLPMGQALLRGSPQITWNQGRG